MLRAIFLLYLLAVITFAGQPSALAQALAASGIIFSCGLAVATYGWRGCVLLFGVCLVISFAIENIGTATGYPFGRYHFTVGAGLPHIGAIPIIVGPLYFGVGFLAWLIAGVLLDDADRHLDRPINVIALPVMAAFATVEWDVVMDPPGSTLDHAWIWHDGGGYFGVPLSNFVGWFVTTWLFFQAFALMIHRWPGLFAGRVARYGLEIRFCASLLYLAIGLSQIVPYLTAGDDRVADATGHLWQARDVRETAVIVMAFTMAPTAILALFLLAKGRRLTPS